ncbi:MAG: hypothetical protein KGZ65_04245 [Sphingomonadales bacterium]|nr:hypothetical protein [Sphingomonadaceae bacterium]MBS3930424.1 hypothetical protein [Sphingomonadales bacterium]
MRATRYIGIARKVHVKDLQPGMALIDPIVGLRGKVLVCAGEVLSVKHVAQLKKVIERPGVGCLLNYTREVWAQATDASGDEKPACETNPYEAFSVQRVWKKGMSAAGPQAAAQPSSARKVYRMVDGQMTEVDA